MKVIKPTRHYVIGRHAAFVSRLLNVHVWQGTYAGWTVCIRVIRFGGCWNIGRPW